MTTTLLKYLLNGMLKGIEEYESMLEKEHIDPTGKLADILRPIKVPPVINAPAPVEQAPPPKSPVSGDKIDLDELLRGT